MTTLFCIQALAEVVGAEVLSESMLPLLLRLSKDPVPNIRFNVAKVLRVVVPLIGKELADSRVRPILKDLAEDEDVDVKYFANIALKDTL